MAVKKFFNVPQPPTSISTGDALITFQYSAHELKVIIDRNHFAPSMPHATLHQLTMLKAEIANQERQKSLDEGDLARSDDHIKALGDEVERRKESGDTFDNVLSEIATAKENNRQIRLAIEGADNLIEKCKADIKRLEASLPPKVEPRENEVLTFTND